MGERAVGGVQSDEDRAGAAYGDEAPIHADATIQISGVAYGSW